MSIARPPLVRIQYIDQQLKERRFPNCMSVARHFEVSAKSIQRDIDYMRYGLHAPIAYDPQMKGYYYETPGWAFLPSTILERREAEALVASRKVLAQYKGSPFHDEVCRALDKLRQYLPEASGRNELLDMYSLEQPTSPAIDPKTFAKAEDAIRTRQKLNLTYKAAWNRELTQRTVHPYMFRYSSVRDIWYLIAYCELRSDIRTFAMSRIRTLSITAKRFSIPKTFNVDTYLDKTFEQIHEHEVHDISIRFTPYQAQWIREHRWHPSQVIEEHENGGLTLRMKVGALEAVKRWVMRYGSEAQVLEPQELRKMIRHELLSMENLYEDVRAITPGTLPLFRELR